MDSELLKQIKSISLDMLVYFDNFCRENKLDYWISFGTLLGGVRHQGFIPWDDDVDVEMPIESYRKLVRKWFQHGDKEHYFLQTKKTDPYLPYPFYRLRKNGTTWIDPGFETMPIHWGIPIDIFPIYHRPTNRILKKIQDVCHSRATRFCTYSWNHPQKRGIKPFIYTKLTSFFLAMVSVISSLSKKSDYVYHAFGYKKRKEGKKDWFLPSKSILFEGVELRSPANPHEYLQWQYGDYMELPPEEQRQGHNIGILDIDNGSEIYTHCLRRNK